MSRRSSAVVAAVIALAACSAGVADAAPPPSAHDRALVRQLADKLNGFKALGAQGDMSKRLQTTLTSCPQFKKNPGQALGAVFALVPAMLIDIVNQYGPQIRDLHSTLAGMHADSPLFASWLTAEHQSFDLLLSFDNHGKKIDYCRAATVMLEKNPSRQELQSVLGIDPAQIAKLFTGSTSKVSVTLQRLNPKMRGFFRAAGLPAKTAAALTQ